MHKLCLQLSWITGSNQFRSQNFKEIHWIYKYWDISFFEQIMMKFSILLFVKFLMLIFCDLEKIVDF